MEKPMEQSRLTGLLTSLPGRYAKTLFDIASQRKETLPIIDQFKVFIKLLDENQELGRILVSSALTKEEHISILTELCSKLKLNDIFKGFFHILADNGRLDLIRDIQNIFQQIYDEQEHKKNAEIVSAQQLTSAQKKQLSDLLKSQTTGDLTLTFTINPHLLGGFYVRNQNQIMDFTFANRLINLVNTMKGIA